MNFDQVTREVLKYGLCLLMLAALPAAAAGKNGKATSTAAAAAKSGKTANTAIESKAFSYFVDKEPSWVRSIEVPATPSPVDGNPDYRILLRDDQKQYTDKDIVSYVHRAFLPLQKSSLEKVAQIEIEFSPEYETLTLHKIVVRRNGEVINKLDRSKIRLIEREKELEARMYNGVVSASILLDDVRTGDVVEYAYSIRGANPIFGGRIDTGVALSGWEIPVEQLSYRLLTPAGRKFSFKAHGLELEPKVTEQNGVREMVWSRTQIPAMIDENEYPRWYIPAAWLEISEYDSWAQVSDWAKPMYRVPDDLSPALLAQIEQWRSMSANPQEAALRALNFVQQEIRYFGVEIGTSSHRPSHPNQVFQQRYGDCKDKSLLLTTILNRLGFKAYPALVSARTQRGIEDFLPTPHAFDHVITRAEIGGKTWWLDATNNFQAGGFEQRGYESFDRALVIGDGSTGLTVMTVPDDGERSVEEVYTIEDFDQPVKLVVTERLRGPAANRIRFLIGNYGAERMGEYRLNQYARVFQGIRRSGQSVIADDHEKNVYTITDTYVVDNFFQRGGGRWKADIYNLALRDHLEFPKVIKRKSPLELNRAIHARYSATLAFRKRNNGSSDESLLLANDYLQFLSTINAESKQVVLRQQLDFLQDHVPATDVAELVEKETQIRRQLGFSLSFPDRSTMVWSENASRQAMLHAANAGDIAAMERQLANGIPVNVRGYGDVTPLLTAIMDGRIEAVRWLIAKGAEVNARSADGWSPLLSAALFGADEIVAELLRAGADIKATRSGETALMLAAEKGHDGVIRQLLKQGAEVDRRNSQHFNHTALMYAALNGHAAAVQALLDAKANMALKDEKEASPFLLAAESGDWATMETLLKAGANPRETSAKHGIDAMIPLVRSNRYEAVAAAINYGLEINGRVNNGFSPLMYAMQGSNRRIVELLKNHGARYREVGKEGWTPLMSAIEHLDAAQARKLIEGGADTRAVDNYGMSALTLASAFGLTDLAEALLKKGADVNSADKGWRETPLMYAVENGNRKMVELLVSHGADVNVKDVEGDSVLGRTYPMEKADLYDVLVAAGAKREFVHPAQRATQSR
ncbi:MAG TPA: ankyrin repeat domain-containing protein [Gallionella sp.]|nr:ankyrin repeat domain-containing protein [Gallionella sp.]